MDFRLIPILVGFSAVSAGLMVVLPDGQTPMPLSSPVMEDNPSSYAFLEWQDEASWGPWGLEISDVDLNGFQEILVGSSGTTTWDFRIYNGSNHDRLYETLLFPYQWHNTVSAGNVNDDPLKEIILPSMGLPDLENAVVILQWDGSSLTQIWASGNLVPTTTATALFDVDEDGKLEVFALCHGRELPDGDDIYYLYEIDFNSTSGDFDVVEILSLPLHESLHKIKFYDIDKDGMEEIILRSSVAIYALDTKTMTSKWGLHKSELRGVGGNLGIDVGDPDGDGEVEIVASGQFHYTYTTIAWIDVQTRSIERMTPVGHINEWSSTNLMIYDVDQDTIAEVVVPITHDWKNNSGGFLTILDGRTGSVEFRSRNFVNFDYFVGSVEVGNVDTDSEIEVLVSSYVDLFQYQVNASIPTGPVEADLDCDPDTLNLNSRGNWITCYIELLSGYDPRDINASTILLNDALSPELDPKYGFVKSEESYIMDHDADGILERMVKFDRSEVEDLVSVGDTVVLSVRGELVDGTRFEGNDNIRVINPPLIARSESRADSSLSTITEECRSS